MGEVTSPIARVNDPDFDAALKAVKDALWGAGTSEDLVQFVETTMVREHDRVYTMARKERSRVHELLRDVKSLAEEKKT